jgi:hypothetical protein
MFSFVNNGIIRLLKLRIKNYELRNRSKAKVSVFSKLRMVEFD